MHSLGTKVYHTHKGTTTVIAFVPFFPESVEAHVRHIRAVLQRLVQFQLYEKIEKCDFDQTSTSFLRYIISLEGVAMEKGKVKAVVQWPQPIRRGTSCLPWSEEATRAFTSAPFLHHPDPESPFVVEVDASSTGLGAVLSQCQGSPPKLYPCAYYSRKLSPLERNYDVSDRELLAMKAAFEEWRHFLEGSTYPRIWSTCAWLKG